MALKRIIMVLFLFYFATLTLFNPLIVEAHTLGYSIYTNESLLTTYKGIYTNANSSDVLIDDVYNKPPRIYLDFWNEPEIFPRMILANNYTELTSGDNNPYINDVPLARAYNFTSSDYIAYDSEDWTLTPSIEQVDQAYYTGLSCNFVHNAGYRFAFTPEIDVPRWGQFPLVNWSCVDFLDLQEQFLTQSPTLLADNVTAELANSKGKNPNLIVFVQLEMNVSTATLEQDISDLSNIQGVNGVMLQDLCKTNSCNNTLVSLIDYTKSQGITDNSTISTTTVSTTSTTTIDTTTSLHTTSTTIVGTTSTTATSLSTSSSSYITSTILQIGNTTTASTSSRTTSTTIRYHAHNQTVVGAYNPPLGIWYWYFRVGG